MRRIEKRERPFLHIEFGSPGGRGKTDPSSSQSSRVERHLDRRGQDRAGQRTAALLALTLSLLVILIAAKLPLGKSMSAVHWYSDEAANEVILNEVDPDRIELLPAAELVHEEERNKRQTPPRSDLLPPVVQEVALPQKEPAEEAQPGTEQEELQRESESADERVRHVRPIAPAAAPEVLAVSSPRLIMGLVAPPRMPDAREIDQPPRLRSGSLYVGYPREAREDDVEGRVILHFFVDKTGQVSGIRVVKPLHPACDRAAVEALLKARFSPGRHAGRPVSTYTHLAFRFVLK